MSMLATRDAASPTTKALAIEVSKLSKSFGQTTVLDSVSFSASKGDVVSILGSSGSGKSTMLRCLNLLETPNSGEIVIGNMHLSFNTTATGRVVMPARRDVERLRQGLGMVFQGFNLWSHMTVLENIIEAPIHVLRQDRKDAIAHAEELLAKVGLSERRHAYPAHLSGGQQQRAAIARALAMQPDVMLFDEPTSALDPELVGEVLRVMRALAEEGRTMLVVTHEMSFARDVSSKVLFLHKGSIIETGEPRQMFANPQTERFRQFIAGGH